MCTITVKSILKSKRKHGDALTNWDQAAEEAMIRKPQEQESKDVAEALPTDEELRTKTIKDRASIKVAMPTEKAIVDADVLVNLFT